MENPIKFYVVFTSATTNEHNAYGPFKSASAAKSWMAQEFNNAYEVAKKKDDDVKWNWNEEQLGFCKIEDIGIWEVVKNSFFKNREKFKMM